MMAAEDRAEGVGDPRARRFGRTQFVVGTPATGIEARPDDRIVLCPAAFEPARMDPRGGVAAEDRIDVGGVGAGDTQQGGGGDVFLGTGLERYVAHGREVGGGDAQAEVADPEAGARGRGFAEHGGRDLPEVAGRAGDPALGVVARREREDVADGRDVGREAQAPDAAVAARHADRAGRIGGEGERHETAGDGEG